MRKPCSPERRAFHHMKDRCYNVRNPKYRHYGGRGIEVCAEWQSNFQQFLEDVGPRPSDKHSLDRIDTDGDYRADNVRWATDSQQNVNRRPWGRYSSYRGVSWDKNRQLWQVRVQGKHVGRYESEEDAARAYDETAEKVYGAEATLNFPRKNEHD